MLRKASGIDKDVHFRSAPSRAAQIGRTVAYTVSVRYHLSRHSHGRPHSSISRETMLSQLSPV